MSVDSNLSELRKVLEEEAKKLQDLKIPPVQTALNKELDKTLDELNKTMKSLMSKLDDINLKVKSHDDKLFEIENIAKLNMK